LGDHEDCIRSRTVGKRRKFDHFGLGKRELGCGNLQHHRSRRWSRSSADTYASADADTFAGANTNPNTRSDAVAGSHTIAGAVTWR
jgi:hypothetical protein